MKTMNMARRREAVFPRLRYGDAAQPASAGTACAGLSRPGVADWIRHPIRSYRAERFRALTLRLQAWHDTHGPLFDGIDGVAYQRMIRDEWENCP